jgi:hypothetical protein
VPSDPLATVEAHPAAGAAIGAGFALISLAMGFLIAAVGRDRAQPFDVASTFRYAGSYAAALFAAWTIGGATLPLLRTRRRAILFGVIQIALFLLVVEIVQGGSRRLLPPLIAIAVVLGVPFGIFLRYWVRGLLAAR